MGSSGRGRAPLAAHGAPGCSRRAKGRHTRRAAVARGGRWPSLSPPKGDVYVDVLADIGMHTEVVVLIIPTLNDSVAEIRQLATWLVEHMGPDVPVHFIRFHPVYRMLNLPPTPVTLVERARDTAMDAGLHFVYLGNVPFHDGENTYCPSCGALLIRRIGYRTEVVDLSHGACAACGCEIPGVWTQGEALSFKPR